MNLLFRLFIFLGSVVVVLLFAALIAPYFIDWDEFTNEFEAQASRVVGQEVKVGGKTNLRLLPLPYLSFEDLQVGNNNDDSPLMTVEQFSFKAELLPFLSGQVRIVEMSMHAPKVNLQVGEDGTIAWTNPKEFLVNPEQVNIEKLNIKNGSIFVKGLVGERSLHVENIQGDLNAKSILGPWRIDASADVEGVASQIKIATGIFQDDDSLRLKMDLSRNDQPYNFLLDGPVKLENNALSWNGDFRISPFVKSQIDAMIKPVEPLAVVSSGSFQATPSLININEYRLDIGSREDPYTITGQGSVSIHDEIFFKVQADGRQIDIDLLKNDGENVEKTTLESRLIALHDVLKRVPVPSGKGEINLILPAIVAGDTYIRDVKGIISPTGAGWAINSLNATLPGNTAFEAKGRLGLKNGFGFSGKLLIASRQPSGFADWVSGNVDDTFRRLKSVGLSSDLTITKRQASLENVELRLDDAVLRGKLQRLSSENGQPALLAELKGNRVNWDDLSAIYSLTQTADQSKQAHDLNIKVKADVFEAMLDDKSFTARGMDAHVQVKDGTVSIERLNADDLLGAKIATTGRIENVLNKPNGNMKLNLSADDASQVLAFASQFLGRNVLLEHLQSNAELTQNTQLDFELDTTENAQGAKGRMLVNGSTGGTDISLQLGFDGVIHETLNLPMTVDGVFKNESPSRLIQQLGLAKFASDFQSEIPGALKFDFSLSGIAAKGFKSRFALTGQDALVSAKGKITTQDWNAYDANLDVTLGVENAAPYVMLLDLPIPNFDIEKAYPFSSSFNLKKVKSDYEFSKLEGQLSGNKYLGEITLKQTQLARPQLSGAIKFDRFDLPTLAESVFGRTSTLGASLGLSDLIVIDENSVFGEPLFAGLDARLSVNSDRLNLTHRFMGKNAKFQVIMIDGAIDMNALSFDIMDGKVEGGINLKNTSGDVQANINYAIRGMSAQQFTSALGMADFISGNVTLNGSVQTTGQSTASLISNLAGNGFIALKEGEVRGINAGALSEILKETSLDNYEITSEKIQKLFVESTLTSGIKIAEFDTPFSINRGKMKARNIAYLVSNTAFRTNFEYDLQTGNVDANTVIEFKPSRRNAISGAAPEAVVSWAGLLTSLERSVNTDRLEGYLSLRAFEASQRRLETLEAQVIEKQRLRYEIAYAFVREQYQERKRLEALRLEEERKLREAEEQRRKQAEAAELDRLRKIEEAERLEEQTRLEREKTAAEEVEALQRLQTQSAPAPDGNIVERIEEFLNTN